MLRRSPLGLVLAALLLPSVVCMGQQDGKQIFTAPKAAGLDYQLQGEYTGELADGAKWGAQVIALGKGKFKSIGYRGGLPGEGWSGEPSEYLTGEVNDGIVKFEAPEFYVTLDGTSLKVFTGDGDEIGDLKKSVRKSETLGMKPPEGAVVLFAGAESIGNWKSGKLIRKRLLGATDAESKRKFRDHSLHLEFRTPFMPTHQGQARGNSGVYVQSRYELQVLDSFGLAGKNNECGGFYQIAKPKVNMCFPPLTWQTYDIDFTAAKYEGDKKIANARVKVRHNGVVIHEDLELPKHTPGRRTEGPQPESLFLQNHGDPVVFRNIWVVEK